MIKFIEKSKKGPPPTLEQVEVNQFFVYSGSLCQKRTSNSYLIITDAGGVPCADFVRFASSLTVIERILPEIAKIEY